MGYAVANRSRGIRNIPTSFAQADEWLGKRLEKKICNNTWIMRNGLWGTDEDRIYVKFHNTVIVEFRPDGSVKLNSGGWRTTTTKQRIKAALKEIGYIGSKSMGKREAKAANIYMYPGQKRVSVWWFWGKSTNRQFEDGMIVYRGE